MIRLGAPLFQDYDSPVEWVAAVRQAGFRAAYCPVDHHADDETISAYAVAAEAADICIAEVGAAKYVRVRVTSTIRFFCGD